jgi:16S rRNA U516 pseudouridylate synthase RsuA-like enzyme
MMAATLEIISDHIAMGHLTLDVNIGEWRELTCAKKLVVF